MKTKIREYRVRHGLTQEELARKVGVRRETIVFLEKGRYNPSLFLAFRISKILQVKIEELFEFDERESEVNETKESNDKTTQAQHEHHKRSYIP